MRSLTKLPNQQFVTYHEHELLPDLGAFKSPLEKDREMRAKSGWFVKKITSIQSDSGARVVVLYEEFQL